MAYEKMLVAVDPVILTIKEGGLYVYLKERSNDPFKGFYELPGGLLRSQETSDQALMRKLKESLNLGNTYFTQFLTFTDPRRDPRERAVSIGYLALVPAAKVGSDGWFDTRKLPKLAFDHAQIIDTALNYLKENIQPSIVKQLFSECFSLNDLQRAYEIIEGTTYDNRNFRKRIIAMDILEQTKEHEHNVSHRPALLYRFKSQKKK